MVREKLLSYNFWPTLLKVDKKEAIATLGSSCREVEFYPILGSILFNIFLGDLFLIVDDIANYEDGNTIYKEDENIDDLITSIQDAAANLFKWFSDNQMKGNTDKYHSLLSKHESSEIHIGDAVIESSNCEKLLDIKIDSKLRFDDHNQDLCNRANRKLRALARATPYMILQKIKVLMKKIQRTIQLLSVDLDASYLPN